MTRSILNKIVILVALLLAIALTGLIGKAMAAYDALVLARVAIASWESIQDLPVYAILQDEQGNDYALVLARLSQLEKCEADYEILDRDSAGATYWLARIRQSSAKPPASGRWVYFDGRTGVIRIDGQANSISQTWQSAGYDLLPLPDEPLILNLALAPALAIGDYNPEIADMISQVNASMVYTLTGQLTGDWPTTIGGYSYSFTTRNSKNSTAIQNATQFAYEFMQTRNLSPVYHNYSGCTGLPNNRNVIGELPGNMAAEQIILITAHIDNLPASGLAPGADDNASGAVGVFTAADILSQYEFERTLRFVIFTGEEQGMCGSKAYADQAFNLKENIVAVLNLDMIAWDGKGEPVVNLHTRYDSNPSYVQDLVIANAFINVVNDYGLSGNLSPEIIHDGETASDHSPFWNKGFPAILAIEDDYYDFNPHYHTLNDKLSSLNQIYYVNFVRAAVGTAATLALLHNDEDLYLYLPLVVYSAAD